MSTKKECRYAIYYKNKKGIESNLFPDGRSFKTYKWANTIKNRQSFNIVEAHGELYLKEVPKINTDTDRLNFLIEKEYSVQFCDDEFYIVESSEGTKIGNYFKSPREAIDAAMMEK